MASLSLGIVMAALSLRLSLGNNSCPVAVGGKNLLLRHPTALIKVAPSRQKTGHVRGCEAPVCTQPWVRFDMYSGPITRRETTWLFMALESPTSCAFCSGVRPLTNEVRQLKSQHYILLLFFVISTFPPRFGQPLSPPRPSSSPFTISHYISHVSFHPMQQPRRRSTLKLRGSIHS